MKLSIYTFAKDALYLDFHLVPMLKHHLALADEIIVNEGYSSDGTYEAIKDLDPRIKVYRNRWDESDPRQWSMRFKNQARELCTGDWCLLLDCDEFLPDWQFQPFREFLETTELQMFELKYLHFYGNYRVLNANPKRLRWPVTKRTVHRNRPDIEVWGDGSNVKIAGRDEPFGSEGLFDCHHFGFVRHAARLRQKWRAQRRRNDPARPKWDLTPGFIYNLLPHNWQDPDILPDLRRYDGPYVKAVLEDPDEFVRDRFRLLDVVTEGA